MHPTVQQILDYLVRLVQVMWAGCEKDEKGVPCYRDKEGKLQPKSAFLNQSAPVKAPNGVVLSSFQTVVEHIVASGADLSFLPEGAIEKADGSAFIAIVRYLKAQGLTKDSGKFRGVSIAPVSLLAARPVKARSGKAMSPEASLGFALPVETVETAEQRVARLEAELAAAKATK